jgi:hypothetical protein
MGRERNVWKEVPLLAVQSVALGAIARVRFNLENCLPQPNNRLILKIGRTGTTALTAGPIWWLNQLCHNGQVDPWAEPVGGDSAAVQITSGNTGAASQSTVSVDAAAGQNVLTLVSTTGIVVGDSICIRDAGLSRVEWHRVSKVVSATVLNLVENLRFTHTAAQGDSVASKADILGASVNSTQALNGAVNELIFDYGASTTGEPLLIHAHLQYPTFNSGSY